MPLDGPISQHALVQVRAAALHRRRWRSTNLARHQMVCVFVVREGQATIVSDAEEQALVAPAVLLIPAREQLTIDINAGCDCICIGLSESLISESVGTKAESIQLSRVAERLVLSTSVSGELREQIETLILWCDRELSDASRQSRMCIVAYARLLLLCVQRTAQDQSTESSFDAHLPDALQRFRHLVELHYREQWSMQAYADAMGMTYDRLHALCRRELDSTPHRLVQQRLANEAQVRLEHSGQSVKEIGALLGFPDAPAFSHFFKRMVGQTPGRYRSTLLEQRSINEQTNELVFADWP